MKKMKMKKIECAEKLNDINYIDLMINLYITLCEG